MALPGAEVCNIAPRGENGPHVVMIQPPGSGAPISGAKWPPLNQLDSSGSWHNGGVLNPSFNWVSKGFFLEGYKGSQSPLMTILKNGPLGFKTPREFERILQPVKT